MDLIIGNLKTLKDNLLPAAQAVDTTFDAGLQTLGKGVAAMMERHCARSFSRVVGDTYQAPGGGACYVLPRFPVEAVTCDLKYPYDSAWSGASDLITNWDAASGIVNFATPVAVTTALVRFTFTGGYWIDTTEDASGSQPAGSAAMPQDLVLAWITQCQDIFTKRETALRRAFTPSAEKATLGDYELSPMVKSILETYRRITL